MFKEKGFTLIELLVSVAIVGILASMAIAAFSEYKKEAYNATAQHTLRDAITLAETISGDMLNQRDTGAEKNYNYWVQPKSGWIIETCGSCVDGEAPDNLASSVLNPNGLLKINQGLGIHIYEYKDDHSRHGVRVFSMSCNGDKVFFHHLNYEEEADGYSEVHYTETTHNAAILWNINCG